MPLQEPLKWSSAKLAFERSQAELQQPEQGKGGVGRGKLAQYCTTPHENRDNSDEHRPPYISCSLESSSPQSTPSFGFNLISGVETASLVRALLSRIPSSENSSSSSKPQQSTRTWAESFGLGVG
jgi:hypothetical protein